MVANIEKQKQTAKLWRQNNPERFKRLQTDGHLKRKYGISIEDYNRMLREQNGICAICHQPERAGYRGKPRSLAVDHCHKTGKVRGLLCMRCNRAIGLLSSQEDLQRAVAYLAKFSCT